MFLVYCIFFDKEKFGFNHNHFYIGQHHTNKIDDGYMGSGKKVKDIYLKYGSAKAEKRILAITEDENICNILEIFFIGKCIEAYGNKQVLNIAKGGKGVSVFDKSYMVEAHKKTNAANRKLWKEHPERFLERNKKISESMKGNLNFWKNKKRTIKINVVKKQKQKNFYSEKQIKRHLPNPLGKWRSATRSKSVSKVQMEKVYFYSLDKKEYKEFESIKTCWQQMGFSSESTALRHCRYCTDLLKENKIQNFETIKAVKIEAFLSKIPFDDILSSIESALINDSLTRDKRLELLEQKRREKIANYNLTKRDYSSLRKHKEVIASC